MKTSMSRTQWVLIITLALAVAPYFVRLGSSSLWDSNEAFYAETPREMIEARDYINPTFDYRPRLNKPPLSYWAVIPFYKLFGVSEASERLPIVLGALIMIATAYALGRVVFSETAGLLAAIGLAIAPRFLMFSRRIMIDVYLAMFMALALLMFVLAERRPERRRLYLILMYVSIGLGVLTKGPVAVALPALVLLIYLAAYRRLRQLRELMLPAGLLIVAVIVSPWYVAIYAQHGWKHIETFIFQDNLSRYTQAVWGPRRGFDFYFTAIIGDFFPWSIVLIPVAVLGAARLWSLRGAGQSIANRRGPVLLAIWVAIIVVFFSFSKSKEDLYILPIYPAAAALVGGWLARFVSGEHPLKQGVLQWTVIAMGASIALAGAVILFFFGKGTQPYEIAGAGPIGFLAILGGIAAAGAAIVRKWRAALLATALSVAGCNWAFALWALPDFERFKPVRPLCQAIVSIAGPDSLVGYYRTAYPSMVFYLRREVFEYYHQEEIDAVLTSDKEVFCLMSTAEFETLRMRMPQIRVLASHPTFQVKLNGILDRVELPRVVLISNKGGTNVIQ